VIDLLYLIGSLPRAGAGRHLLQLVRALDRTRFTPRVLCLRREGELVESFEESGVRVGGLGVPGIRHPLFLPSIARLLPFLRSPRPHVLHTYLFPSNLFGSIAGRLARVPVVITSRRSMSEIEPPRHIRAYRWLNGLADGVVAVSEAAAESASKHEGLARERITVIENGIDVEPYAGGHDPALKERLFGLPAEARLVGMVSNFRPTKGQDDFIEMARLMASAGSQALFTIVGEGQGRAASERKVAEAGLASRFHFAGLRGDIPEVLRALDVFLYPSYSEGISNALMEAMAAGCPIVAARCPGNETIMSDSTCVFVPPSDAQAFADAALRLLANREEAVRLGAAARGHVTARFGARRMASGFESLYLECLSRKGVSVPALAGPRRTA